MSRFAKYYVASRDYDTNLAKWQTGIEQLILHTVGKNPNLTLRENGLEFYIILYSSNISCNHTNGRVFNKKLHSHKIQIFCSDE